MKSGILRKRVVNNQVVSYRDLCIEALRRSGCRITNARIAVIECIAKSNKPLSAPDIFDKLKKSHRASANEPLLDKVSVYRVLDALLDLNLVHRVAPTGEYLACNHLQCLNVHHVILRCTECNKVEEIDIPKEVVAPLLSHMQHNLQFIPNSHLLHMDGQCLSCRGGLSSNDPNRAKV